MRRLALACAALAAAQMANADFEMPASLTLGASHESGDVMQSQLMLEPKVWGRFENGLRWNLAARLRLDAADHLEPGRTDFSNYSSASTPANVGHLGTFELGEAFLEHRSQNGRIRLGKQAFVWGKLDGIKVLDAINPQDFREFILDDFERSRLTLWGASIERSFGDWRGELAIIPDSSAHQLPTAGAWFELSAPRFRFGATSVDGTSGLNPATLRGGTNLGLRLSRQWSLADLSLVAYDGTDFEPVAEQRDGALQTRYTERQMLGLGVESALGPLVLRTEIAYQPDRSFNFRESTGLRVAEFDQTRAAFAVDFNLPGEIFVNLQFLYDSIQSAPEALVRPQTDRLVTASLRRSFGYDAWLMELRWYHSLTDRDDLVSGAMRFSPDDRWQFSVSVDFFAGTADGLFGQFDAADRISLSAEYLF